MYACMCVCMCVCVCVCVCVCIYVSMYLCMYLFIYHRKTVENISSPDLRQINMVTLHNSIFNRN